MRRPAALLCSVPTLCLVLLSLLGAAPAAAQSPQGPQDRPVVDVIEISGVLDGSQLGALADAVAEAPGRQVDVLLVQLDSFGGLGVDPAEVLATVRRAPVPVAVWVGGAAIEPRAEGAAALVVAGADVVATRRQASIGRALPAELGRGRDAAAERRVVGGSGLPAAAVEGRLDGPGAIAAGLADYEAESVLDTISRLDGRSADGRTLSIGDSYRLTFLNRSLVDRVAHGLANPTLAYLLVLGAGCAVAFEWLQPGFGVAGVAGLVVAALAVYALVVLPTNWLALGALVLGLVVFSVDTAVGGLGLGTLSATALTTAGSWWLFSSPSPLLRVDGRLAVVGVLWCLVYWVGVLTVTLKARRTAPEGTEALVGSRGVVRSMLNPGGIVVIEGAMWRARLAGGDGLLPTGQRVSVTAVADGILQVVPEDPGALRPAKRGRLRRASQARQGTEPPAGGGAAAEAGRDTAEAGRAKRADP
jgi:membrane-bound serine protease (ClpP class)